MKKYLFLGLILLLTGCQEANEIFGGDEYWALSDEIVINEDGYEQHYEGPVYINATSWGSMAYVCDHYVNSGVQLLVSESSNAEGGKVLEVNSNQIFVNDLGVNKQYYYCLYIPEAGVKSQIKKVVIPDISSLNMTIVQQNDLVSCTIEESIPTSLIIEKGFKVNGEHKYVVDGEKFECSIYHVMNEFAIEYPYLSLYAYVITSNATHRTYEIYVDFDHYSNAPENGSGNVNYEDITLSDITEETIDDIDYLKCTVTGYVDEAYFTQGWYDNYNQMKPDKIVTNDEGTVTTFYLKKGFLRNVCLTVCYKFGEKSVWGDGYDYYTREKSSYSYYPSQYNIRTQDEFMELITKELGGTDTINLLTDITIPSDMRMSLNLRSVTLDGNGHTLDGISFFPFFREIYNTTIKNLKIGTDATVYSVKRGTYSSSTTNSDTPRFLLTESSFSNNNVTFENCEIRGSIQVYGREDFYISKDYSNYWLDEDKAAGTFDGYIVRVPGLKDYTKTEFK